MAWKQGRYYVQNRRIGRRVVTQYIGGGLLGQLAEQYDQIERDQRDYARWQAQQARRTLLEQTRPPAALVEYIAAVRAQIALVLTALGFHQHRRQWRMKRMSETLDRAMLLYRKPKPSADELAELRGLVTKHTNVGAIGDLAVMAEQAFDKGFNAEPSIRAAIEGRSDQIRQRLGWAESSELERLLIREIVLCWRDYNRVQTAYAQQTTTEFKLNAMEQWERVLSSKQRRYLRACEALARVRRLLRLPNMQINIAAAGGQQVNVAGELPQMTEQKGTTNDQ
jgi:hypothetical protein